MKRRLRTVGAAVLVSLAAALGFGIAWLYDWGGRIETQLSLFGDLVWVTLDTGHPRIFLLLLAPGVMLLAARSLYVRRSG